MTDSLSRAAVIGAGTMGAGIASHLANAGIPVLLLDLPAPHGGDRSALARRAVERLRAASPPPFMHPDNAASITPGNVDDDLHRLAEVDWIAEAVVERIDDKRALYRRIDAVRRPGTAVSSNTSTLPLSMLLDGMPAAFRADFCITHFFNPVRYMRLLELVAGPDTRPELVAALTRLCDERLGKGVVACRDTPGFLANRVGVFALQVGLVEALAHGLGVEQADAIMGRPMGIPKTGLFGLYDLIGIDLMQDVVRSLAGALPPDDPFQEVAAGIPAVDALVRAGRTGNKSGAGFYRSRARDGEPVREALDLPSGEYHPARRAQPQAARAAERGGLRALVSHPDACGRFAARVLSRTLAYAASLLPEVTDRPQPVDEAMQLGYSWQRGPFEMIDELGAGWLRERLAADGRGVPPVLAVPGGARFYRVRDGALEQRDAAGRMVAVERPPGVIHLGDLRRTRARIAGNDAASLWDVGEGVACLAFHTKANALSPRSMEALADALERTARGHAALLLHGDGPHFSVGFDLGFVLDCIARRAWSALDEALRAFQDTCRGCRDAPVPVVGAAAGLALGGGYEVLAHCDAVQAHGNVTLGLVETLVGLVPAGGGCKELLRRWSEDAAGGDALEAGAREAFRLIATARTAGSPDEARPLRLLGARDRVSMNRDRLLAEARALALELAAGYAPPPPPVLRAPGAGAREAMLAMLERLRAEGVARPRAGGMTRLRAEGVPRPHDITVGHALARVLGGGEAGAGEALGEQRLLALEREAFLALAATPQTRARIEHMLEHGRALRN